MTVPTLFPYYAVKNDDGDIEWFPVGQPGPPGPKGDTGATGATGPAGASGSPTGSAGGALDGTYPNPGLAASVAGAGLAETSDVLSVNVDASTIEINSDTLRVKADGITANEIAAGAVGASELASTAVTPASYGDATHVGQFTVDADGRLTAAASVAITSGGGGATKLYDYEVTGSDKASIDTNVDGTTVANFAGYTTLLVYLYVRTDEVGTTSQVSVTLNNDTGANYDRQVMSAVDTAVAAGNAIAATAWNFAVNDASYAANYFSVLQMTFPNYLGTAGYKNGTGQNTRNDNTNANSALLVHALNYRSTSAISRLKVTPLTALKLLKVGTRLLIYGL